MTKKDSILAIAQWPMALCGEDIHSLLMLMFFIHLMDRGINSVAIQEWDGVFAPLSGIALRSTWTESIQRLCELQILETTEGGHQLAKPFLFRHLHECLQDVAYLSDQI